MDDAKKRHRDIGYAEAAYQKRNARERSGKAFFENPYRFAKGLFVAEKSGDLLNWKFHLELETSQ